MVRRAVAEGLGTAAHRQPSDAARSGPKLATTQHDAAAKVTMAHEDCGRPGSAFSFYLPIIKIAGIRE